MIVMALASGTSADGIDVGVIDLEWGAGAEVTLRVMAADCQQWPTGLRDTILDLLPPRTTTAARLCEIDTAIGQALAAVARLGHRSRQLSSRRRGRPRDERRATLRP